MKNAGQETPCVTYSFGSGRGVGFVEAFVAYYCGLLSRLLLRNLGECFSCFHCSNSNLHFFPTRSFDPNET